MLGAYFREINVVCIIKSDAIHSIRDLEIHEGSHVLSNRCLEDHHGCEFTETENLLRNHHALGISTED